MATASGIAALYREFTDALTEVLAENAVGPARRGRLARARAVLHELFFSRRDCVHSVGSLAKRRSLAPEFKSSPRVPRLASLGVASTPGLVDRASTASAADSTLQRHHPNENPCPER